MLIGICTQIFLNMPRIVAEDAGTAGWLLTLYVSLISIVMFAVVSRLYKNFEGKDLLDIAQETLGSTGMSVLSLFLSVIVLILTSAVLRGFAENMKIISLNLSPLSFVMFFFAICMGIGAYMGIEAITRVAAITVPVIIAGYVIIALGVLKYAELSKITPWLGAGPYAVFVRGLPRTSLFSEGIAITIIAPFLKTNKNFRVVGYTGFGLSAFFMTMSALIYLLIYQFPTATENFLPMYQLARLITYGRFFERIESLFVIIWAVTAFIYLSYSLFLSAYIFQKGMRLTYYRPIIFPLAIIVFSLASIPSNLMVVIKLETEYIRKYTAIFSFIFTIILLVIGTVIKKRKKRRRSGNS